MPDLWLVRRNFRFDILLGNVHEPLDIRKPIDGEGMLGVEGIPIHERDGVARLLCIRQFDENVPIHRRQ